jgi:hypothetical protein
LRKTANVSTTTNAVSAYGLWEKAEKEEKHLLSEEEELEKKALKAEYHRDYNAKPAN